VASRIVIDTFIKAPPEICFDLALNVEAHAESAAFSGERVVEPGRLSGTLQSGDMIAFEGFHFGIRQRFVARIGEVERPSFFTDEMVHGIFKWLRHRHEFHERDGGTLMRDILEWEAPLGVFGRVADRLFLRRHMNWFVATKQSHLKVMAERDKA
jgi:ligand-binding SRPBCC domain-containing protein